MVVPFELDVDEGVDVAAVGVPASVGAAVAVVDGVVAVAAGATGAAAIGFWPPPLCMPIIVLTA